MVPYRVRLAFTLGLVAVVLAGCSERSARSGGGPGGVISTGQRVTPAGIQTVFDGRVEGVAFGASDDELLVLVRANGLDTSGVWRIGWKENRVLGRALMYGASGTRGSPGMQGIRVDPVTGMPIVSFIGPVPVAAAPSPASGSSPAGRPPTGVLLASVADSSLNAVTGLFGRTEAGAPAIARRSNADGQRLVVVPLTYENALAVIDIDSGIVLWRVPTGIAPFGAAIDAAGTTAWVTNWGGRRARKGDTTARAGTRPESDDIVVDSRGIASTGTVTRVDLLAGQPTHTLAVGLHPTAIVWDEEHGRVYVAAGNTDAISVIDARENAVVETFTIAPFRDATPGLAPTALALTPDGTVLYVALGGLNAVAVLDARTGALKGLIPTAWYPGSISLSEDGTVLAVGAMLGTGSGTVPEAMAETDPDLMVHGQGYVHRYRGSVNVIPVPGEAELAAYTVAVASHAGLALAEGSGERLLLPARTGVAARAVPERPGESSRIDHVVFIIKENRTYDQVLGDVAKGNGDPDLAIFGGAITPNHHRLADQFVLFDNFFATGGNSGDGHQWLTQANETDYAMWGFSGRSYPFDGTDPIAPAWGGFLWDAALGAGRSVLVFGEYAGSFSSRGFPSRIENLASWRAGEPLKKEIHQVAPNRRLDTVLAPEFPGFGGIIPDVVRARIFLARLEEWNRAGAMPDLVIVQLPSDHTSGTTPGWNTPAACLADNDWALGQIVEGLSSSRFWSSMAIFVVEDDAQNGVDHVDGHRTVALAVSPFIRRGTVDHTWYAQQSMVKTIELMLGLRPMSLFDLTAPSMSASFIGPDEQPDYAPYAAVEPGQSIYEVNPSATALRGPAREAALQSARMNFHEYDAAPSDALNRILWHTAKGWDTPYPGARRSLFFPMAADLADEAREPEDAGGDRSPATVTDGRARDADEVERPAGRGP